MTSVTRRTAAPGRLQAFAVVVGFFLLLLAGPNKVSLVSWVASACVVAMTLWAILAWWRSRESRIPLLALVLGMYCIYFVFGEAWGPRKLTPAQLAETAFEHASLLVALGCLGLVLGFSLATRARLGHTRFPDLNPRKYGYVLGVSLFLAAASLVPRLVSLLGPGGRQILTLATKFVPLVVFAILLRRMVQRRAGKAEIATALLIAGSVVVVSLGGGWMGELAALFAIFLVVFLEERRRLPVIPVLLAVVYVAFFQVGKNDFRNRFWAEGYSGSYSERISYWVGASVDRWAGALGGTTGSAPELAQEIVSRVSLVDQLANVVALTPDVVPYQGMGLYSYALYTFIPRAIWPEKPSINEANRFYQWAYGIVSEGDESTSVSVGILAEGFIAFGWLGAFVAMFAKGVGLGVMQNMFFSRHTSELAVSIGIAMVPSFLLIESQFAVYFAWLVQAVFVALLVLYPALSRRARRKAPADGRQTDGRAIDPFVRWR